MFQPGGGGVRRLMQCGDNQGSQTLPPLGFGFHEVVAGQVTSSTPFCTITLQKTEQWACGPFSFLTSPLYHSLSQF